MSIEGNINTVDLASVFQMLFNNRREGVLIVEGSERKHILFSPEGVTLLSPPDILGSAMGLALLRERRITPEALVDHRREAQRSGRSLVETLQKEMSSGSDDDRTRVFGRIVEEELCEVLAWGKANFQFHSGMKPADIEDEVCPVPFVLSDIDWIVLESVRRMDEWILIKRMIPSTQEIYRTAGEAPRYDSSSGENARVVFSLVDGQSSIDEIIEASYLTKFEVCRTMAHFLDDGVVVPVPIEELRSRSAEYLKRSRPDDALKFLMRAVDRCPDDADLRIQIAEVMEKKKDFEAAAQHFKICAEQALAAHRIDDAFAFLQKVGKMLPRDLDSRERMIDLFVEYRGDYDLKWPNLIEEGMGVASRLAAAGEGARSMVLLRRLVSLDGNNLTLRAQLINTSLKLGRSDEAIAEYEGLAREFFQRGNLEAAAKIYDKILAIDGSRRQVFEKLRNLEELISRRKRSRRRKRIFAYIAAGFLALAGTGFLYYRVSRRAYDDLGVAQLLADGRFKEAVSALDGFGRNFPFSPISFDARTKRDEVLELSARAVREEREQRVAKQQDLDARRARALALIDQGELEEALERLREIAGMGDEPYLERHSILPEIEEVETYLAGAADLLTRARASEADGDLRSAQDRYRLLRERYPLTRAAREATLPVEVVSSPPGAHLVVNGESTELRAPVLLHVPFDDQLSVDLRLEGFDSGRLNLSASSMWREAVELSRTPLWVARTGGAVTGSLAVAGDAAFVGDRGAGIRALRVADGKELWAAELPGIADVAGGVAASGTLVFAGSNDMRVRALDRGTGAILWSVKSDGFVSGVPVVLDRHIVIACRNGVVTALSQRDGKELWKTDLGTAVVGSPVTDGARIYLALGAGEIALLDARTGETQGRFGCETPLHASPLVAADLVVAGTSTGSLWAFDRSDGRPRWRVPLEGSLSAPVFQDGRIYVTSDQGWVYCLDLITGSTLAARDLGAPILATPAVGERQIYVGTESGSVHCLSLPGLEPVWKTATAGRIQADLVLGYGTVFVATDKGCVLAYLDEGRRIQ